MPSPWNVTGGTLVVVAPTHLKDPLRWADKVNQIIFLYDGKLTLSESKFDSSVVARLCPKP